MPPVIVCGVDHSDSAPTVVQAAAALAHAMNATLVLAHATSSQRVTLGRATPHPGFPAWAPEHPATLEPSNRLLERLQSHADPATVEPVVLDGSPAGALAELAKRLDAALLVIGTRGGGPLHAAILGSVSTALIRRAPCPAVVVPDVAAGDAERPLVDGSTILCGIARADDRTVALAAAELASTLELRLRLAHVLDPHAPLVVPIATGARVIPLQASTALCSQPALGMLNAVLDDVLHARPELTARADVVIRRGPVTLELADLAIACHAAAIVVGNRGRGRIREALTPSRAGALAAVATVPVIACRDDARERSIPAHA